MPEPGTAVPLTISSASSAGTVMATREATRRAVAWRAAASSAGAAAGAMLPAVTRIAITTKLFLMAASIIRSPVPSCRAMRIVRLTLAVCITASLAMAIRAEPTFALRASAGKQAAGGGQGGRAGGAGRGAATGAPIGGTLTPAKADARGWGWAVKASVNRATKRPFYNKAKELLFQDQQITSYTIQ